MKYFSFILYFMLFSGTAHAEMDDPFAVNVKDSSLRGVLELVAAKTGLQLVMDSDPGGTVSLSNSKITGRALLDKLSTDQQIEYTVTGNQLIVRKHSLEGLTTSGNSHLIPLRYALATEMVVKVNQVIDKTDRVIADEHANSLIFVGSAATLEKVQNLVNLFDVAPKQIMIEAIIVATSHNFLQQLGVSIGDVSDPTLTNGSKVTGYSSNPISTTPTGAFKAILGHVDSRALDLRLTAAETNGNAKVVSRPKVVTLNNRAAKLQSGVTYHIKTLSNVPNNSLGTGTSNAGLNSGVVTGSLATIDAALSLNILPLLIGDNDIKMIVDINDSSPDAGTTVDGIPGILTNSASTAVIVKDKQTAVIAGLIKQTNSKNATGVPFLMDIPILGNLFKTTTVEDRNNELVIFLTPTIDSMMGVTIDPALLLPKVIEPPKTK